MTPSPADSARHVALEPCPFCGSPATFDRGGFGEIFAACSKCWCHMGGAWSTTEQAAADAWNRRALRQGGEAPPGNFIAHAHIGEGIEGWHLDGADNGAQAAELDALAKRYAHVAIYVSPTQQRRSVT